MGSFSLPNLPPGEWEFQVWHNRGGFLSYWPQGRFKQIIQPGENSLGTIKLKPEQVSPSLAASQSHPGQNREKIGEVLGKPVYRDEIKVDNLYDLFGAPVRAKYREVHQAEITPTEDQMKFATEFFEKEIRERIESEGGLGKKSARMKVIEAQLSAGGLTDGQVQKLEIEHQMLRVALEFKKSAANQAWWALTNWKGQKHVYEKFGGGRILIGKFGCTAFDAGRKQMESREEQGDFQITDPKIREQLYSFWTRDLTFRLVSDPEKIRQIFLEPEYVAPAVQTPPTDEALPKDK
jgi:hypothetical protein